MTDIMLEGTLSSPQNSFLDDDDDESQKCRRCNLSISEGHAYELGGDRWHMYCFGCSKCSKLLGTSSNFLVLGTGDLICSECSYACNACGKKIDDLAILTGEQAYCSSCFCCRNCKKRIEDLRYARTSKGLFCMTCHEKLLEKKKRHDQDKKSKELNGLSTSSNRSSLRNSKYANHDKSLPKIPPTGSGSSIPQNASILSDEASSEVSTPDVLEVPKAATAISTTNTSSVLPPRSPKRKQVPLSNAASPSLKPPVSLSPQPPLASKSPSIPEQSYFDTHDLISKSRSATPSQRFESPPTSLHTTPYISNQNDQSSINNHETPKKTQYLNDVTPLKQSIISPNGKNRQAVVLDNISSSSSNNILSSYINESPPPKIPIPELPAGGDDFIDMNDSSDDDQISKYAQSQGFQDARQPDRIPSGLNIQGIPSLNFEDSNAINEHNQFQEQEVKDYQSVQETIQDEYPIIPEQQSQQSQQQQYVQAPNTPGSWKFGQSSSSMNPGTLLSPSSPSPTNSKKAALANITNENVSRSKSIRSPKSFLNFRKHKKSASGSSVEPTPGSSSSQKGKYYSPLMDSTPRFESSSTLQTPRLGSSHMRGKSDTSPYQGAALFTTPPIPENRHHGHGSAVISGSGDGAAIGRATSTHVRSASDANTYRQDPHDLSQYELELRALRIEIFDLKQARSTLRSEVGDLSSQRDELNLEVLQLNSKLQKLKIELDEQQQTQQQQQIRQQIPPMNKGAHHHQDSIDKANGDSPIVTVLTPPTAQDQPQQPQQQQYQQHPFNDDGKQQKTKGRFWRRNNVTKGMGGIFNKNDTMASSQSSYSLSHLLNEKGNVNSNNVHNNNHLNNNPRGNPQISAPLLRNEEADELGGNDNKKLINGSKSSNYIDLGTSSSNSTKSNSSQPNLIMSDLFNSTLEMRTQFEKRSVPLIVTRLIREVEARGIDSEGIYRKNGGTLQMNNILKAFNNLLTAETSQELESSLEGDINALTSSLKKYLYFHLPEPIINMQVYESFINVAKIEQKQDKINELKDVLQQLPRSNLKTLMILLTHIKKIEQYSKLNKMTFHNLAVVFAPTFTRVSSGERELADMQPRNNVTEFLLTNQDDILENIEA